MHILILDPSLQNINLKENEVLDQNLLVENPGHYQRVVVIDIGHKVKINHHLL